VSDNPTVDQVSSEQVESSKVEENVKSRTTWLRLLFMAIYGVVAWLVGMVGLVIVVLGFFWVLFTGEVNRELRQIGQAIASYIYEIVRYLTFNTDDKPFPFGGAWPSRESQEEA
jgi:fatty acid desaturase